MNYYYLLLENSLLKRLLYFAGNWDDIIDLVEWRDCLPLLSVCRKWRQITEPLLYRHAIVEYGNRPVEGWRHNVSLFTTPAIRHNATCPTIWTIYTSCTISQFLYPAIDILMPRTIKWPCIYRLQLYGHASFKYLIWPAITESDNDHNLGQLMEYKRLFLTSLDNLRCLDISGIVRKEDILFGSFLESVVEYYIQQLCFLRPPCFQKLAPPNILPGFRRYVL